MPKTSFYLSLKFIELEYKSQLSIIPPKIRTMPSIIVDFKKEGVLKIEHPQYGEKLL